MTDKNGIEIKTGDIVEITGSYFKTDNGFYFVERSEGDPGWLGSDYCLHKISKRGKISQAKKNICFWPIAVFISDRAKTAEARKWNQEHAEIRNQPGGSRGLLQGNGRRTYRKNPPRFLEFWGRKRHCKETSQYSGIL